jgi:hypothetical protein
MRDVASLRALAVLAFVSAALVALAAPAAALTDPPDQIVLSGALVVPRGTDVGEVVVVHGSARVDGVAHGDVVVLDGPVVVRGQVGGSIVAIDGRVTLGPDAQVNGDVTSRGAIAVAAGAKVGGRVRQYVAFAWRKPIEVVGRFASWLAVSVSTLLLGLLLVLLAPRALDAVAGVARTAPWPSAGWAAGIAVGVPVVIVLAVASLVALPLGLVVLLGLALLAFVGYVLSAYAIGRAVHPSPGNRALAFAIGWAIVRAIAAIPVVSGITFGLAAVYGLGAAIVATWRARAIAGRHRGRRTAEIRTQAPAPLGEEAGL